MGPFLPGLPRDLYFIKVDFIIDIGSDHPAVTGDQHLGHRAVLGMERHHCLDTGEVDDKDP